MKNFKSFKFTESEKQAGHQKREFVDEPYSAKPARRSRALPVRQATYDGHDFILCILASPVYGYSAERS